MAIKIGVELSQYVTITVDTDDVEEAYRLAKEAIENDSPDLDRNEQEINSMEFLAWMESDSDLSDRSYEEYRDALLFASAS